MRVNAGEAAIPNVDLDFSTGPRGRIENRRRSVLEEYPAVVINRCRDLDRPRLFFVSCQCFDGKTHVVLAGFDQEVADGYGQPRLALFEVRQFGVGQQDREIAFIVDTSNTNAVLFFFFPQGDPAVDSSHKFHGWRAVRKFTKPVIDVSFRLDPVAFD